MAWQRVGEEQAPDIMLIRSKTQQEPKPLVAVMMLLLMMTYDGSFFGMNIYFITMTIVDDFFPCDPGRLEGRGRW